MLGWARRSPHPTWILGHERNYGGVLEYPAGLRVLLLWARFHIVRRRLFRNWTRRAAESWGMLGLFGVVHGASEWLDLIALVVGDVPTFAVCRTAVMAVSYVFLLEFARLEAIRFGWKMPGSWIFIPLVGLVILAWNLGGVTLSNVVARYALGLPGAMATSLVFLRHARELSGADKKLAISVAIGFGLYAVAAGAITPAAPVWPASMLNYQWFTRSTGIPIQLIRGLLASWMALSIWLIWGEKLSQSMASARYTRSIRKQFAWTLALMAAILMSGWMLTQYLGEIYNKNVQAEFDPGSRLVLEPDWSRDGDPRRHGEAGCGRTVSSGVGGGRNVIGRQSDARLVLGNIRSRAHCHP